MTTTDHRDTSLVRDLYRYELAWPALQALAGHATTAMRYRDLLTALAGSGHTVYSRTLDNALKFLTYQGLASREERQPKQTTYRITDLGRRLAERLTSLEAMVRDHRGARRRHRHPG